MRSRFFRGHHLNLVHTDFPCFAWPVGVWRYINQDGDRIQRANASDREDYVHLRDMIATDCFDQPRYLEDIPGREIVESFEFYWDRDASSGSLGLMEGSY